MANLGTFDRRRIERDIEQAEELLERYEAEAETAEGSKLEELQTEIDLMEQRLAVLRFLLK